MSVRTLIASLLICLTLAGNTGSTALRRESCSCTADDGSCSASTACVGGCIAVCPGKGSCFAICTKGKSGGEANLSRANLPTTGGRNGREAAAILARRDGGKAVLNQTPPWGTHNSFAQNKSARDADGALTSVDIPQYSTGDAANVQSARRALINGERVAVCFKRISAGGLADELSLITGLSISVEAKDADTPINYSGKRVTFKEMLEQVSKLSGVQFSIR